MWNIYLCTQHKGGKGWEARLLNKFMRKYSFQLFIFILFNSLMSTISSRYNVLTQFSRKEEGRISK